MPVAVRSRPASSRVVSGRMLEKSIKILPAAAALAIALITEHHLCHRLGIGQAHQHELRPGGHRGRAVGLDRGPSARAGSSLAGVRFHTVI